MSKYFNHFLIKILVLSTFMVLCFNIWDNLINANSVKQIETDTIVNTQNSNNFKIVGNSSLWKTWVAITTNLWIRFKQTNELPATIYRDIFSVSDLINDTSDANNEIIWTNMTIIEEYKNVLQTDVKQLVDTSYDKISILNAFISQLEYRYKLGIENMQNLTDQKEVFMTNMETANASIEILKVKIESDFSDNNSQESLENINKYLEFKQEYYYSRTYIVYINHFLSEYTFLSEYNKKLLDTIINNKEAIIKDAYIVIPDSGTELMQDFNLIYTEEQFKQ